ncbi:MAG TPA: tetratricopeptide repeat protein [Acidobacteriota bacterium]|nr:tetratricopeptide repeat protein [Acidobacteriota bacterium]
MSKRSSTAVLLAFFFSASVWAQQGDPKPPSNPNPNVPSTPRPSTPDRRVQQPRIIHLAGRVTLDEGTPPPEPVYVDLLCNGQVIRQALTRSDGRFNFTLGDRHHFGSISAAVAGDPLGPQGRSGPGGGADEVTLPGGIRGAGNGRFDMNHCTVRLAPLPGFSSNELQLGFRSVFDSPDLGLIVMKRLGENQGTLVSLNSLNAPKKARKAYEKGRKELSKRKPNLKKAGKKFQEAIDLYPEYAAAWQQLGVVRMSQQNRPEAREAFETAAAADPKYLAPLLSLTRMELEKGSWQAASQFCDQLMELDSSLPQTRYYSGLAYYYLKRYDTAFDSLNMLREGGYSEKFPAIHFMLGDIWARKGQMGNAALELRTYLKTGTAPEGLSKQVEKQLLEWEKQGLIPKGSPEGSDGT